VEGLESFGKQFQLHPLRLEDSANTDQRPTLVDDETSLFLLRERLSVRDRQDILVEQVSLTLRRNVVRPFQENGTDVFKPVRDHLRGGQGRLRHSGARSLLHALVDAVPDLVGSDLNTETLRQVHALKRQVLFLRRAVWPRREATNTCCRPECPFLQESTKVFSRDVYDHGVQSVDTIETRCDMGSARLEISLSHISSRLNAVRKVLTIS